MKTKICSTCGVEKSFTEFSPRRDASDGLTGRCVECIAAHARQYYRSNSEKLRAYRRNYGRLYRYGISEAEVGEMISQQEWHCAICGRKIGITAHIDHDHDTGVIRGILCKECNIALGLLGDNAGTVMKAADYLLSFT